MFTGGCSRFLAYRPTSNGYEWDPEREIPILQCRKNEREIKSNRCYRVITSIEKSPENVSVSQTSISLLLRCCSPSKSLAYAGTHQPLLPRTIWWTVNSICLLQKEPSILFRYTFSRRILTGLIFSCIGDALLVWPSCFTGGMCMFALAQIMYISAFGFIPLNIMLGTILYAMCSIGERLTTRMNPSSSETVNLTPLNFSTVYWLASGQQFIE